jgi:hypothetical protein
MSRFLLFVENPAHSQAVILATLYHTTNVPQHTATPKAAHSPETLLLGRGLEILLPYLDAAVLDAATRVRNWRCLEVHSQASLVQQAPHEGLPPAFSSSESDEEE